MSLTLWVTLSIKYHLIGRWFYLILNKIRWDDAWFVQFDAILRIATIKLLQMNIRLDQYAFIIVTILVISHIFYLTGWYIGDLQRCKLYFFAWSIVNSTILTLIRCQCAFVSNGRATARSLDYLIIIWILMGREGRGADSWQHTPSIVETRPCPVLLSWIIVTVICCQVNIKDSHVQNFPILVHRFLQVFWVIWNLSFIHRLLFGSILT